MDAADRVSALPDDVLQRVLSFAPAKEAAASAILSRRWRSLWRGTRAVILDSRPYEEAERDIGGYTSTLDAFFHDAHAALAAFRRRRGSGRRRRRGRGLKRLTLVLAEGTYRVSKRGYSDPEPGKDSRVADLLDDPAVARLEELSIGCKYSHIREYCYSPTLASLPCAATLRVLEITNCNLEQPSQAGLSFPHLTDLTLQSCYFLEGCLQGMIDASPALAVLALVHVNQRAPEPAGSTKTEFYQSDYFELPLRFRCPTVTAVSLRMAATYETQKQLEEPSNGDIGIELDIPSLRFFRYYGFPVRLSLTSPTMGLERVDLDITLLHQDYWRLKYERPSRMLANFSSTRALKLRLSHIEDLVAATDVEEEEEEEENVGDMLLTFPNLKLLEIDGKYKYMKSNTAVATAMLLRSCPAMSELRFFLDMQWDPRHDRKYPDHVGGSFGEAMDRFESLGSMSSAHLDDVKTGGISELPDALTNNYAFSCLQKSLRKVKLQFKAKEFNCFQMQLAKFLVENAMVLEEMHVDNGSQFWTDHLFHKVARWRADAFRRRNLPNTGGFRVYQLANRAVDSNKVGLFGWA